MTATRRPRRMLDGLAVAVLAAVLGYGVWRLLRFVPFALRYPYELDYGEGIVLQQMRNMVAGTGYAPLGVYPGIVYHYPPVYHLTTAALAWGGGLDDLAAGRAVALLATLGMAVLTGGLTATVLRGVATWRVRATCGVLAALILTNFSAILLWSMLMRVDMLATALDLAGLALAIRALTRPRWIYAAALAFALALYTKQTMIAAPAATFAVLLVLRPGLAGRGIATMAVLGLGALAVIEQRTAGGFLHHILLYNINRFDVTRLAYVWGMLLSNLGFIAAALVGVGATVRRWERATWRSDDPVRAAAVILLAWLTITTLMLGLLTKVGSNENYFIEWLCGIAVFAGVGLRPLVASAWGDPDAGPVSPILWVLAIAVMPFQSRTRSDWNNDRPALAVQERQFNAAVPLIRASAKPVIADPMTLLIRAGRPVEWEPAIAAELAHTGVYDEAAFVRMIRARRFGFFLLQGDAGQALYRQRYNPAVGAAIDAAYPVKRRIGELTLHLPPAG